MNTSTPKISVLMSAYNGSIYLRESIESILNQTFTDFEFIIINDCSTDNSWEIITEYAEQDQRIKLVNNQENIGLTKSLNKGLNLARGEYIARQDADDVSLPQRFEKEVLVLNNNPEVALVSCDIEIIDSQGNPIDKLQRACEPDLVEWYLIFCNRLAGHSQVMFRRELVVNLGGYCESYRYSQDYELWCRIVKLGKILILPEILLQQRRHEGSISKSKTEEQNAYAFAVTRQNISQLIGKEISLEEAKYLMYFWVTFSPSRKAPMIHSRIKEIKKAFIEQKKSQSFSEENISLKLDNLIGNQFVRWIKYLNIYSNFLSKILISFYGLVWKPFGVLESWM
ncbi:glycosyl transferase family protein [Calothrix parasitica NIES-267]|uniref:Glycosyl transferase family protein n=1 Tax=Calothrix parasitica NIES-267 TaxID=1973488 RepID=A0A1Z4M1A3_9CYAN|nr:glycosyl transferase family protein [Calothrix parasitica NIES-267]